MGVGFLMFLVSRKRRMDLGMRMSAKSVMAGGRLSPSVIMWNFSRT